MMMIQTIRMRLVLWKLMMAQPPCRDCECKHWRQRWAGLQRTPTTPQISKPPPRSQPKPRDTPNPLHPITHLLEVKEWSIDRITKIKFWKFILPKLDSWSLGQIYIFRRSKYGQVRCPWKDLAQCSSDPSVKSYDRIWYLAHSPH